MPEVKLEGVEAVTAPVAPTRKGNSRYVIVPSDWPDRALVRLVLQATPP